MNKFGLSDDVVSSIISLGKQHGIERIILFGSRARGDFHKRSDIDLAVSGGNTLMFSLDVEEIVPTLLFFDVVNLDGSVQDELRGSISNEGIVIYEKV